jgi:predicted RND superfamily exporter protein
VIRYRKTILIITALLAIASGYFCTQLRFSFDFEQFFPKGDPDLAFFQEFRQEFESDDNFLLVALVRREGVFDSTFLNKVHDFSLGARTLPYVTQSQSLTQVQYPVKTPFGITSIPAIARNEPARYAANRERLLNDERFVNNLINADATALVTFLKTKEQLTLAESRELMAAIDSSLASYQFAEVHMLGRPYFQVELVDMQIREVVVSSIVAAILVAIIMFIVFRRPAGILVALSSIGLGLLFFMGFMGATGRELTAIAALYPVLMIIVGTSDVIHIMTKYIDELRIGKNRSDAIQTTIREIGLATLLTSITTAIGFATLLTSRITPIRDFGINAAVGVVIAYLTVIFFTTACLTYFSREQVEQIGRGQRFWDGLLGRAYQSSKHHRIITVSIVVFVALAAFGISRITTNYSIIKNLPRNRQITADFQYF